MVRQKKLIISAFAVSFLTSSLGLANYSSSSDLQRHDSKAQNEKSVSDHDISEKIQHKIGPGWFSKGYDQVTFQVNQGNVLLRGSVKTMADREKVEKDVKNISGVRNVTNEIRAQEAQPYGEKQTSYNYYAKGEGEETANSHAVLSDPELNEKIKSKIGSGWFSKGYENVTSQVRNGNVILQGTVKTWEDKEKVDKEVRNIEGVLSVDSQIKVQEPGSKKVQKRNFPQDTYSTRADDQLNRKIRDNVSSGWLWDSYEEVTLNTNNGVITLEGVVDNLDDQRTLMLEIQKIDGVKAVKSNLDIRKP